MEYSKHEVIGRLIEAELLRNRKFRREIAKLPLGNDIFQVLASPIKSVDTTPKKWYQKLIDKFKVWNNKDN